MSIVDGINLGIGLMLSPLVLLTVVGLALTALGVIAYPFVYLYLKYKTKKNKKL
jgi:hypothetical protein